MSALNEVALQAALDRKHERELARQAGLRREAVRLEYAEARVRKLIENSKLSEWFPGVEWEVYLPEHNVICPADRLGGTNPELTTVTLTFSGNPKSPTVQFASSASDRNTHYTYWSGPSMHSAADVGEALAARILAAGDRWLGNKCVYCGFRGTRSKTVGGAFVCVDTDACKRRKELVESGQAAPPT